mmetsp:Transcript_33876/g.86953  ORF Transcript_33876/g.86953 Transcript_33876/m.86953 type:complete len:229 (-) Transcript_33876:202-888(-)
MSSTLFSSASFAMRSLSLLSASTFSKCARNSSLFTLSLSLSLSSSPAWRWKRCSMLFLGDAESCVLLLGDPSRGDPISGVEAPDELPLLNSGLSVTLILRRRISFLDRSPGVGSGTFCTSKPAGRSFVFFSLTSSASSFSSSPGLETAKNDTCLPLFPPSPPPSPPSFSSISTSPSSRGFFHTYDPNRAFIAKSISSLLTPPQSIASSPSIVTIHVARIFDAENLERV